jgi:hypothetical protein
MSFVGPAPLIAAEARIAVATRASALQELLGVAVGARREVRVV